MVENVIIHVVLYEPNSWLTTSDIEALVADISATVSVVPAVQRVRVGKSVDLGFGYHDRSQGQLFGYVAIFEFGSVADITAYMTHPAHAALAEKFWKFCERTMIVDVEAVDPTVGRDL